MMEMHTLTPIPYPDPYDMALSLFILACRDIRPPRFHPRSLYHLNHFLLNELQWIPLTANDLCESLEEFLGRLTRDLGKSGIDGEGSLSRYMCGFIRRALMRIRDVDSMCQFFEDVEKSLGKADLELPGALAKRSLMGVYVRCIVVEYKCNRDFGELFEILNRVRQYVNGRLILSQSRLRKILFHITEYLHVDMLDDCYSIHRRVNKTVKKASPKTEVDDLPRLFDVHRSLLASMSREVSSKQLEEKGNICHFLDLLQEYRRKTVGAGPVARCKDAIYIEYMLGLQERDYERAVENLTAFFDFSYIGTFRGSSGHAGHRFDPTGEEMRKRKEHAGRLTDLEDRWNELRGLPQIPTRDRVPRRLGEHVQVHALGTVDEEDDLGIMDTNPNAYEGGVLDLEPRCEMPQKLIIDDARTALALGELIAGSGQFAGTDPDSWGARFSGGTVILDRKTKLRKTIASFAAVSRGALELEFGHLEEAKHALEESVRLSMELKEKESLALSIALLAKLEEMRLDRFDGEDDDQQPAPTLETILRLLTETVTHCTREHLHHILIRSVVFSAGLIVQRANALRMQRRDLTFDLPASRETGTIPLIAELQLHRAQRSLPRAKVFLTIAMSSVLLARQSSWYAFGSEDLARMHADAVLKSPTLTVFRDIQVTSVAHRATRMCLHDGEPRKAIELLKFCIPLPRRTYSERVTEDEASEAAVADSTTERTLANWGLRGNFDVEEIHLTSLRILLFRAKLLCDWNKTSILLDCLKDYVMPNIHEDSSAYLEYSIARSGVALARGDYLLAIDVAAEGMGVAKIKSCWLVYETFCWIRVQAILLLGSASISTPSGSSASLSVIPGSVSRALSRCSRRGMETCRGRLVIQMAHWYLLLAEKRFARPEIAILDLCRLSARLMLAKANDLLTEVFLHMVQNGEVEDVAGMYVLKGRIALLLCRIKARDSQRRMSTSEEEEGEMEDDEDEDAVPLERAVERTLSYFTKGIEHYKKIEAVRFLELGYREVAHCHNLVGNVSERNQAAKLSLEYRNRRRANETKSRPIVSPEIVMDPLLLYDF